ncbi:MAG: hypothetical protein FGF50_11160 [Candidatus Brockarchaeota archaeon]|nr:hypothetical protein [Candidatus Brockarchaeota archaeon]
MAKLYRLKFWCMHSQRMCNYVCEHVGYCSVGSRFKVVKCLNPCALEGGENCMISELVEGSFMEAEKVE